LERKGLNSGGIIIKNYQRAGICHYIKEELDVLENLYYLTPDDPFPLLNTNDVIDKIIEQLIEIRAED
jgi:hypothetical protein